MCPYSGRTTPPSTFKDEDPKRPPRLNRHHGFGHRGGEEQPKGNYAKQGKFGRMFPSLDPLRATQAQLDALGNAMSKAAPADNPKMPAGFTYLGQFIDHDITLDTTALGEVISDPGAVQNFRSPKLDLDCLYGRGPVADPHLYQRGDADLFQIGQTNVKAQGRPKMKPSLPFDLPRSPHGYALIGDPRNDENLVVAQTHLALLRFHNKVVEKVRKDGVIRLSVFEDARQLVQWHYQWIVLNDFLRRIVDEKVLDDVLTRGRDFFCFEEESVYAEPYMPVEFSVAAYRFGHSMVRETYDYNDVFRVGGVVPASLELLFRFSGLSSSQTNPQALADDIPVPSDWIIDWRRFYEFGVPFNPALKIDPFLTPTLHNLPGNPAPNPASLAVRNLRRSLDRGLPSGQDVAAFMGTPSLSEAQLTSGPDGQVLKQQGLHVKTPLWYYILKEAEQQKNGERLGAVGSRIVAEVFVGMLDGDPGSFRVRNPRWKPTLGKNNAFNMVDLLNFAGGINPVEDPNNINP